MKNDLDQILQDQNIDALWVMGAMYNNPDMVYFTGIHHVAQADLFKLRGQEPQVFHFVNMEREEAQRSGLNTQAYDERFPFNKYLKKVNNDLVSAMALRLSDVLDDIGLTKGKVAVSGTGNIGSALVLLEKIKELKPAIEFISFIKDSPILRTRMTKENEEIDHILKMGQLTTEVVGRTADFLTSQNVIDEYLVDENGNRITIGHMKKKINLWIAELGAENPEETIFALGRDAGIPHSTGNPDEEIRTGTPIVFDIFPCEKGGGYFYDFTRTWCLENAPDEVQTIHEQVLSVHHQIIKELQANISFKQVQKRTCELFKEMGHPTVMDSYNLTEGYIHSVGHGLGLDVHEKPLSTITASDEDILSPGAVFTIEPGLYYPSKNIGVRIEDTVYLNQQGNFVTMADYPYDLILPMK